VGHGCFYTAWTVPTMREANTARSVWTQLTTHCSSVHIGAATANNMAPIFTYRFWPPRHSVWAEVGGATHRLLREFYGPQIRWRVLPPNLQNGGHYPDDEEENVQLAAEGSEPLTDPDSNAWPTQSKEHSGVREHRSAG